ncbi:hypothetical protein [Leptolyngbya sp. FACHB-711]|uniref:hypothetical protein n=1 Tax=unclassified Leptolyngbya TaxID=2650499 RepID=UPI0016881B76|nr:hypothetical protein [Leptolyngbya sp. FACHB-711]MBD1849061.1 hypothetical protein [Cyanobacteria bacterium FACHB-502]MBD2024754.1 hypothetical protein [Leptolyngbya sp. FACHB-711]
MEYTFEIIGVSPVLYFFNHQLQSQENRIDLTERAAYFGSYHCTLDAFLESVESLPMRQNWNLDRVVDTVVQFWLNNAEQVNRWKKRLAEAGSENLLVGRLADLEALRSEFESLL